MPVLPLLALVLPALAEGQVVTNQRPWGQTPHSAPGNFLRTGKAKPPSRNSTWTAASTLAGGADLDILPSGSGSPAFVFHQGTTRMSASSSHENKTATAVAEISLTL